MKQGLGRLSTAGRTTLVVALVLLVGAVMATASAAPKPPAPTITGNPANPTTSSSATFTFTDSQSGVTFKCSLDNAAFAACSSPKAYSGLSQGNHTFQVEAVSGSSMSSATSFSWAIVPPTPTITSHPANPTGATTASFAYTDSQSGVGFKCALDGASFSTCASSGITFSGLAAGSHTFQVEAQLGSNPPSVPAVFTWTVDKTPPAVTITFPANSGAYNGAGWSGGCAVVGICGTAADPGGVASVAVALLQQTSNKYWNGSAFVSSAIVFNAATLGSPNATSTTWKYAKSLPPDGKYTVSVRATDGFGNTTSSGQYTTATFTIDSVAPPAPVLTGKPPNPSTDKNPEFTFTDSDSSVTFTCKLDTGAAVRCNGDTDNDNDNPQGEIQYVNLTPGNHCFYVYAADPANNVSTTTQFCWTISGTTTGLTISANSGSPQYTAINTNFGAPLVAKVTNSANNPIPNQSVTFTAPSSGASGTFASPCSGTTCVVTTNANGLATAPTFTANGTAGSYTVIATTPGAATPANFSLINSVNFTIAGSLTPPFYPGTGQRLNLIFTNPNPSPITIAAGGVTITITTNKAGCAGTGAGGNFSATSTGVAVTIPANSTKSLSDLGVASSNWPLVSMIETHTNQDACQGAALTLHYSGGATG